MPDFGYDRLAAGQSMPGIFIVNDQLTVGDALRAILFVVECSDPSEWNARVLHLPL